MLLIRAIHKFCPVRNDREFTGKKTHTHTKTHANTISWKKNIAKIVPNVYPSTITSYLFHSIKL